MRSAPLLAGLAACGPANDTTDPTEDTVLCPRADDPTLTLALGGSDVTPIVDGQDADLVTGPQGGHHIELAFITTGAAEGQNLLDGELIGTVDGAVVASSLPLVDLYCDPASGEQVARSLLLVFDALPEDVADATLTVDARLTDAERRVITATTHLHVLDKTQESP